MYIKTIFLNRTFHCGWNSDFGCKSDFLLGLLNEMPCSKGNKEKYHNYVIIPKPVKQIESLQINLLSLTNILSLNL